MKKICLIGGINYATIVDTSSIENENSIPSNIHSRFGGVAYNIAIKLSEYGDGELSIISVISKDSLGKLLTNILSENEISFTNSIFEDKWSSYYCHINNNGNSYGFDDMRCLKKITPGFIKSIKSDLEKFDLIFIDGNLEKETISYIVNNISTPIFFDGTSPEKAIRIKNCFDKINVVKLNYFEYCKVFNVTPQKKITADEIRNHLSEKSFSNKLIVSLGKQGSLLFSNNGTKFYEPKEVIQTTNALRAGDSFVSGIIRGFLDDYSDIEILKEGTRRSINVLKQNIKDASR